MAPPTYSPSVFNASTFAVASINAAYHTWITGWGGFTWGMENSLKYTEGPSDPPESLPRIEFGLVLKATRN